MTLSLTIDFRFTVLHSHLPQVHPTEETLHITAIKKILQLVYGKSREWNKCYSIVDEEVLRGASQMR